MDSPAWKKKTPSPSELMARLQSLMQSEHDINAEYSEVLQALVHIEEKQASRQQKIQNLKHLLISNLETEIESQPSVTQNSPSALRRSKLVAGSNQYLKQGASNPSPQKGSPIKDSPLNRVFPPSPKRVIESRNAGLQQLRTSLSGVGITSPVSSTNRKAPKGTTFTEVTSFSNRLQAKNTSPLAISKRPVEKKVVSSLAHSKSMKFELVSSPTGRHTGLEQTKTTDLVKKLGLSQKCVTQRTEVPQLFPEPARNVSPKKTQETSPVKKFAEPSGNYIAAEAAKREKMEALVTRSVGKVRMISQSRKQSQTKKAGEEQPKHSLVRTNSLQRTKSLRSSAFEVSGSRDTSKIRSALLNRQIAPVPKLFSQTTTTGGLSTPMMQKSHSFYRRDNTNDRINTPRSRLFKTIEEPDTEFNNIYQRHATHDSAADQDLLDDQPTLPKEPLGLDFDARRVFPGDLADRRITEHSSLDKKARNSGIEERVRNSEIEMSPLRQPSTDPQPEELSYPKWCNNHTQLKQLSRSKDSFESRGSKKAELCLRVGEDTTKPSRLSNKTQFRSSWQSVLLAKDPVEASLETTAASPVNRCIASESQMVGKLARPEILTEAPELDLDVTIKATGNKFDPHSRKETASFSSSFNGLHRIWEKLALKHHPNFTEELGNNKQSDSLAFGDISEIHQGSSEHSRIEADMAILLDSNTGSSSLDTASRQTREKSNTKHNIRQLTSSVDGEEALGAVQPGCGLRTLLAARKPSPSRTRQVPAFEIKLSIAPSSLALPATPIHKQSRAS